MRVRVLGPIGVEAAKGAVTLSSPRLRRLLAVLVANANRPVSADRMIEMVWANEELNDTVGTLRTNVWRLRAALGEDGEARLETYRGGYLLHLGEGELDSDEFERLVASGSASIAQGNMQHGLDELGAALGLWSGDAYEEFASEEWVRPLAVRLDNLRMDCAERRLDALIELGRDGEAITEAEALIARDGLREQPRARLMLALYRSGRQADALRAFQTFRLVLGEELGLEPSPDLARLEQEIVSHAPSLHPTAPTTAPSVRGYELGEVIGATPTSVIYQAAAPGQGGAVVIEVVDRSVARDPAVVREFERHAQQARRRPHPAAMAVLDCWRDHDGIYTVMPLLANLASTGARARLERDPAALTRIGIELGTGLAALHDTGRAHGAVRLERIGLGDDGEAMLMPAPLGPAALSTPLDDQHDLALCLRALGATGGEIARAADPDPTRRFGSMTEFVAALAGRTIAAVSPAIQVNPYVGLASFQEADAEIFCGRDRLIKEVLERLAMRGAAGRFVAVVGPSGSGKSSAVRAGVIPAVRSGAVAGSVDWFVATMVPGADPFSAFELAMEAVAVEPAPDLGQLRAEGGDVLGRFARAVLPGDGELLVVMDQAEELFTTTGDSARAEFVSALVAAVTRTDSRLRVIITLRGDFYDRPLAFRNLGRLVHEQQVVVVPLDRDELATAIQAPARHAGATFEAGLGDAILADYEATGSLPLLQHALAELFDRSPDGVLRHETYRAFGGLVGGVAQRAEAELAACSSEQRELVRRVFTRLVAPGEGMADTRRRIERRELDDLSETEGAVDAVLDRFGAARLLTFDNERRTREPTVEIAHEALLVQWARLARWIDQDREGLQLLRHLSEAARAWDAHDRAPSELYRGHRLDAAVAWSDQRRADLGLRERSFLDAAVAQRDAETAAAAEAERRQARQNRRLRALATALGIAAIGALVAGTLAFAQRQRATDEASAAEVARGRAETARSEAIGARNRADVDRLVAQSIADSTESPDRAMLLAAAAYRADPRPATAGAVQSSLAALPAGFAGYIPATESSDIRIGREVLVRHTFSILEAMDLATRTVRWSIEDPTANTQLSLSGDDTLVAIGGPDVRVFRATDGEELAALAGAAPVTDLAFDPTDARRLAVGREDGTAAIIDAQTGRELVAFEPQGDLVRVVSFSPDGRFVAMATSNRESALRVFDASTGATVVDGLGNAGTSIFYQDAAFDRSGNRLVGVDRFGVGRVWSLPDGELISRTQITYGFENLNAVRFARDDLVIAGGAGGVLRRWDPTTGRDRGDIEPHAGLITSIDIDHDGHALAVGGNRNLALFDLSAGGPVSTLAPYPPEVSALARSGTDLLPGLDESAARAVVWTTQGSVWTWDTAAEDLTGIEPVAPPAPGLFLTGAELTPDGDRLLRMYLDFATSSTTVYVNDAVSLEPILSFTLPRGPTVAISPDGRLLAAAPIADPRTGTVAVFDLTTGEQLADLDELVAVTEDIDPLRGANATSLSFSPDSSLLAVSNHRGAAAVWDMRTFELAGPPIATGDGEVLSLAFMPDGEHLVIIGSNNEVRTVEARTAEAVGATLEGGLGLTFGAAVSPDGRLLLTGGSDGIQLWDLARGTALGRPYPAPVWADFRWVDNRSFVATTTHGIERFDTDPEAWLAAACELAGRDLTAAEWARFGIAETDPPRCDR